MKALLLALICVLCTTPLAAAQQPLEESLPNLGEPAFAALSPSKAASIGRQLVAQMYQANYIVDDPQLTTFLDSIGWRLAYYGSSNPPSFHFYPIASNAVNAFAMPGANIGVNAGTIVAADDESELAAVMAHEEAHVTQHHIARTANRSQIADIATWAAAIAGMIAASGDPNAIMGGALAAQSANQQRMINYTRGHEMEADRIGIRTLARAGFDPTAMADFFSRMQQQSRLYGYVPPLLLDHPVDSTRIAEATERAAQYPAVHPKKSVTFELMRARARVLGTDLPNDAVSYFSRELDAGRDTAGNYYGYAMALQQTGQYSSAIKELTPLIKKYPEQRNVELLQAQLLFSTHNTRAALGLDRKILDTNPQYTPAILQTASQLIDTGKPREARRLLLSSDQSYGSSIDTYRLLARAARSEHDTAEAAFQMANYLNAKGEDLRAIDQLDAALRDGSISAESRARLTAKRREIAANIPPGELKHHEAESK